MSSARDDILKRIRGALRDVPPRETPADVAIERGYRTTTDDSQEELIEQFVHRVSEYKATVRLVTADALPAAIAEACAARGVQHLVAPVDLPRDWLPNGIHVLLDADLSYAQLDTSDGVLSGCALGIAQTGTIVLDGGPLQGRRVISLLPDYHLCVVRADQIVGLVPEAIAGLQAAARVGQPITFISGPSATSDIELNRVEGVHGPRTLEVLVVAANGTNLSDQARSKDWRADCTDGLPVSAQSVLIIR